MSLNVSGGHSITHLGMYTVYVFVLYQEWLVFNSCDLYTNFKKLFTT